MKHAHTVSWALFALLGVITVLVSLTSFSAAYLNPDADLIGGRFTPAEVANGDPELAAALSARRGTAAAFGLSYGILLFGIAWGPYRRRGRLFRWLLAASLVNALVILLRAPVLGVGLGLITAFVPLGLVVIAAILGLAARRAATAG